MAIDLRTLLAAVLALVGIFYVIAPHNVHIASGFGFGVDHLIHVVMGVVILIVALIVSGVKIFK